MAKFEAVKWLTKAAAQGKQADSRPVFSWLEADIATGFTYAGDGHRIHMVKELLGDGFVKVKDSAYLSKDTAPVLASFVATIADTHYDSAELYANDIVKAIKRALVFAVDANNAIELSFNAEKYEFTVTGRGEDGDTSSIFDAYAISGSSTFIINGEYLLDALADFGKDEKVIFEFTADMVGMIVRISAIDGSRIAYIMTMNSDKTYNELRVAKTKSRGFASRTVPTVKKPKYSRNDAEVIETETTTEDGKIAQRDSYRRPLSDFLEVKLPAAVADVQKRIEAAELEKAIDIHGGLSHTQYPDQAFIIHAYTAADGSFIAGWDYRPFHGSVYRVALICEKHGDTITVKRFDAPTYPATETREELVREGTTKTIFTTQHLTAREAADMIIRTLRKNAGSFIYHGRKTAKTQPVIAKVAIPRSSVTCDRRASRPIDQWQNQVLYRRVLPCIRTWPHGLPRKVFFPADVRKLSFHPGQLLEREAPVTADIQRIRGHSWQRPY